MLSRRKIIGAIGASASSLGIDGSLNKVLAADEGGLSAPVVRPQLYEKLSDAKATIVALDVHTIILANRNTDDGAMAQYRRAAAEPVHGCKFQSRDGAWWELLPDARGISIGAAGGIFDAKPLSRGRISAGSNALSAGANFSVGDVGKTVQIYGAGPLAGWLVTTIAQYLDASSVMLGDRATAAVTNASGWWGTDDTAAIQAAIDYATYFSKCRVYAPAGATLISDTLHCGYGIGFSATTFEGEGYAYGGQKAFRGSALVATFSDRPLVNIQGGRGSVVRGFGLVGQALPWIDGNSLGMYRGPLVHATGGRSYKIGEQVALSNGGLVKVISIDDDGAIAQFEIIRMGKPVSKLGSISATEGTLAGVGATFSCVDDRLHESWNDPGLAASGDSRYAPYAAVSIDAYCGPRPSLAYPAVTYPPWTTKLLNRASTVEQYNKAASSDCLLDDLEIRGFNTAVVNQPCNYDGNGDFTSLRRVNMQFNKYCVSVGNGQSRNIDWQAVKASNYYCAITTMVHGRRAGQLGGFISNLSLGEGIKILILGSTSITGALTIINLYVEGAYQIGDYYGGSSNEVAIIFQSCKFDLASQSSAGRGVPAVTFGRVRKEAVPVVFRGCQFSNFPSVLVLPNTTVFENTTVLPRNRPAQNQSCTPYEVFAHNALAGGLVTHTLFSRGVPHQIKFSPFNLIDQSVGGTFTTGPEYSHSDHLTGVPHYVATVSPSKTTYGEQIVMPQRNTSTTKASLKNVSIDGLDLAFSFTEPWKASLWGFSAGSVIYDDETGTAFFVYAFNGATVRAKAQNNYESDGASGFIVNGFSIKTGSFWSIPAPLYTPSYPMFGTIVQGDPTLTQIARGDGAAAGLTAEVSVGDWVYVEDDRDAWIKPEHSQIAHIDGTNRSMTLSGDATYSAKSKRFALFVKGAPTNA